MSPAPLVVDQPQEAHATSFLARFWGKVKKTDTCWEWAASLTNAGYGQFKVLGNPVLAHRLSFELERGEVPKDYFVCHRCDNRRCVRPDHLFLGTAADNNADMKAKGRYGHPPGRQSTLNAETLAEVRAIYKGRGLGPSQDALAKRFGLSQTTIGRIVRGEAWARAE